MIFFVQLFEAVALLAPDFITLGLVVPGAFSLCCVAKSLGLAGTVDMESALRTSLILGYLVTVAINIMTSAIAPRRSRTGTSSRSNPSVEQPESESVAEMLKAQPVEHGGAFTES
jgi:hypothetical protein